MRFLGVLVATLLAVTGVQPPPDAKMTRAEGSEHPLRHNLQIAEVKRSSDYPR